MAIVTDAWAENDPLGTDGFNTVDDAVQRLERRIRERANQGSHYWNNSTLVRAGRHTLGAGGVVGDSDGEFSIYDEDAATKLFRLCNNNAAVPAADRQAIHYNWAVLKKVLLDGFVDGANVAFALDTGVAVANASAKVFQILVNAVEKLALDKDCKFLTANVPTAGLVANAVHPARTILSGASSDTALGAEAVRVTGAHTFSAGNVGAFFLVNATYELNCPASQSGNAEARLYVNTVLKARGVIGFNVGSAGTVVPHGTISFVWFEPAGTDIGAGSKTIEMKDILVTGGSVTATYKGALYPAYVTIIEVLR